MGYHWGKERRRGTDRRVARDAAYTGADRRLAERRQHPAERRSKVAWLGAALILFVTLDATAWDGYYRHALISSINADAAATRAWSDNVWHFR